MTTTSRPSLSKAPWRKARARVKAASPSCAACGCALLLEADHIVPPSRGGSDDRSNLRTLCRSCNAIKGDRIMSLAQIRAARAKQPTTPPPEPAARSIFTRKPAPRPLVEVVKAPRPGRYSFPVHIHRFADGSPMLVGDYGFPRWDGTGCPPGCTLP